MAKVKEFTASLVSSMTDKIFRLQPNVLFVAGIMPMAVVLTFLFLGDKSIYLDEAVSIAIARSEWPALWQVISHGEANMGLYYILLHLWVNLGESEFFVRSLSAIFAVLTVPTMFVLGARLLNKQVGLLAALLLTVSPFFIQYAQEARSYSLVLLLVTLSSLFFVTAIHKKSKWLWAAYVITSVLAIYAHVFAVFVLAAHAISLPFLRRQDISWKGLLISGAAIALIILPLAFNILTTSTHNLDWLLRPDVGNIYHLFTGLTGGRLLLAAFFILCLIAFVYAVRQWYISKTSNETWRNALLLAWLFAPIVIVFCISQIKPMFSYKYFIVCIPPLVLLTAIGISHIPRRWILGASLVILLALSGLRLHYWYINYENGDCRGATTYVLSMAEEGDAIIFYSPTASTGFNYYQGRTSTPTESPIMVPYFDPNKYSLVNVLNLPAGYSAGGSLPEPDKALPDRLAGYGRIWLVLSHDQITNTNLGRDAQSQMIQNLLQEKYGVAEEIAYFKEIRVFLYTPNGP